MRHRRRGATFLITLAVLTGLIMVLVGAAASSELAFRARLNRMEARRARMAAMAGIQRALAQLAVQEETTTGATTLQDEWALLGGEGASERFVLGRSSFRMQIVDAASRINLNTATQDQLLRLPLTTAQVESLLDFREAAREPRVEGAKDEYYNNLETPYNAKLAPFDTVDELLLVKDFTARVLYEPQTEFVNPATVVTGDAEDQPPLSELVTVDSISPGASATGAAKVDLNSNQANQLVLTQALGDPNLAEQIVTQRQGLGRFTSLGQVIQLNQNALSPQSARTLLNGFRVGTTAPAGRINLNTASEPVLNSIPSMTQDLASAIVSRQSTGFTELGELFDVPGFTVTLAADTVDYFAVDSSTFLVRTVGQAGTTTVALEAVVSRASGTVRIVRIEEPPVVDVVNRWGWVEETTADVVMKEEQA